MEIYPVFSSSVEFLLGIYHILNLYNDYHCSKGVHFTAEYVFFSGSGLLLLNILFDYEHFPKDTRIWGKPTFQRWQQAPLNLKLLKTRWCSSYIIFYQYQDEPSASKDFFAASIKSIGLSTTLLFLSLLYNPLCVHVSISPVQYLGLYFWASQTLTSQLHRWPPLKKLTESLKKSSRPKCWRLHP